MRTDRVGRDAQVPVIPSSWRDGEIAVVGLGKTGVSVVRALTSAGVRVYGSDQSDERGVREARDLLSTAGVDIEIRNHDLARIARARAVIVSPGVPPSAPPVRAATEAGVEVWSEIDVGFLSLPDTRVIGVTGTNGKTTTTALIDHLLRAGGYASVAAGNIGLPLIDVALDNEIPDYVVLELSSFQLHYSRRVRLDVGVLTNLQPDHMNWYEREEDYFADKKRLFMHATDASQWVLNGDDQRVVGMARGIAGTLESWSLDGPADAWFDRSRGWLMLGEREVLPRDELRLLGDHNVANALAAVLAVRSFLSEHAIARGLASMQPLEHRLEPVGAKHGVQWINDSKSTNVASAVAAIRAVEGRVILILGGLDKGEDFAPLGNVVRTRQLPVIVYGAAATRLAAEIGAEVHRVDTLAEAVRAATAMMSPGDAVLLSPACASFDQFENYIERGNTFRGLVRQL